MYEQKYIKYKKKYILAKTQQTEHRGGAMYLYTLLNAKQNDNKPNEYYKNLMGIIYEYHFGVNFMTESVFMMLPDNAIKAKMLKIETANEETFIHHALYGNDGNNSTRLCQLLLNIQFNYDPNEVGSYDGLKYIIEHTVKPKIEYNLELYFGRIADDKETGKSTVSRVFDKLNVKKQADILISTYSTHIKTKLNEIMTNVMNILPQKSLIEIECSLIEQIQQMLTNNTESAGLSKFVPIINELVTHKSICKYLNIRISKTDFDKFQNISDTKTNRLTRKLFLILKHILFYSLRDYGIENTELAIPKTKCNRQILKDMEGHTPTTSTIALPEYFNFMKAQLTEGKLKNLFDKLMESNDTVDYKLDVMDIMNEVYFLFNRKSIYDIFHETNKKFNTTLSELNPYVCTPQDNGNHVENGEYGKASNPLNPLLIDNIKKHTETKGVSAQKLENLCNSTAYGTQSLIMQWLVYDSYFAEAILFSKFSTQSDQWIRCGKEGLEQMAESNDQLKDIMSKVYPTDADQPTSLFTIIDEKLSNFQTMSLTAGMHYINNRFPTLSWFETITSNLPILDKLGETVNSINSSIFSQLSNYGLSLKLVKRINHRNSIDTIPDKLQLLLKLMTTYLHDLSTIQEHYDECKKVNIGTFPSILEKIFGTTLTDPDNTKDLALLSLFNIGALIIKSLSRENIYYYTTKYRYQVEHGTLTIQKLEVIDDVQFRDANVPNEALTSSGVDINIYITDVLNTTNDDAKRLSTTTSGRTTPQNAKQIDKRKTLCFLIWKIYQVRFLK